MLWGFSVITLVAFLFTRYGNERMMYFSQEEVSAVHYLYSMAEPGSQLIAITGTLPWRFQEYRTYKYTTDPRVVRTGDTDSLVNLMANRRFPASYLILTRSQQASGELYIGWPPGTWDKLVESLHTMDEFILLYANQDAEIYGLTKFCHRRPDGRYTCTMPPPGWR
jgi:hypothetical protein